MNPLKTLWHKLEHINEALLPPNAFTDGAVYQIKGYGALVARRKKHNVWVFQTLSEDQGEAGKTVLMFVPSTRRLMAFNAKGQPVIPSRLSVKDVKPIEKH